MQIKALRLIVEVFSFECWDLLTRLCRSYSMRVRSLNETTHFKAEAGILHHEHPNNLELDFYWQGINQNQSLP